MKLQFINKFPVQEAIHHYVEAKVWKIGGKASSKRPASLCEYLTQKMSAFILSYPVEKQEEVRLAFQTKIQELAVKKIAFSIKSCDLQDLKIRICLRFKTCYEGFEYCNLSHQNLHIEKWIKNEEYIEATWKLKQSQGGSPRIKIRKLQAHVNSQQHGRAISFLKILVEEMQSTKDTNAAIRLEAWTGWNSFVGLAHGAYVWSLLGFDMIDYTKEIREKYRLSSTPQIIKIKKKFCRLLRDPLPIAKYFSALAKSEKKEFDEAEFIRHFDRIKLEAQNTLTKAEYPWEIAKLTVDSYSLGKYFTTQCKESSYPGILYPNLPESPGMQQFFKRTEEYSLFWQVINLP